MDRGLGTGREFQTAWTSARPERNIRIASYRNAREASSRAGASERGRKRVKFGIMPAYQIAPVETAAYTSGFARLAEELGFESVWPVEHVVMPAAYASRYPYDAGGRMPIPDAAIPDPLIWNTWAAAATRNLRVGTSILILPQHNPVVLAKALASLDALSGGRVILGIGVGWLREEADAVGSDFATRGRRTNEAIEAMRALWSDEVASYAGEFVRFENVKCNPRPARNIPIHVGGHSDAAARRAGRLGDGFLPLGAAPDELARLRRVMEAAAREAGRDANAIEVTCIGPPDPVLAQGYADAGVTRFIAVSLEPDLAGVKRVMGAFAEKTIRPLGSAA
jgi:probable F420-dependent oxidoreductase